MAKRRSYKKPNNTVIVALIGVCGTIISAILLSPLTLAKFQAQPTLTLPNPTLNASIPALTSTQPPATNATLSGIGFIPLAGNGLPFEDIISYKSYWNFLGDSLELPDDINPELDLEGSLDKINMIIKSNDYLIAHRISSYLEVKIDIQNIQGTNGLDVKIQNQATVKITYFFEGKSHLQALSFDSSSMFIPITGGSYDYEFSPVLLESQDWEQKKFISILNKYDSIILKPGEISTLDFSVLCKNSGRYRIVLMLQVFYAGENHEVSFESPSELICPAHFTLWDPISTDTQPKSVYNLKNLGILSLQNGQYERSP